MKTRVPGGHEAYAMAQLGGFAESIARRYVARTGLQEDTTATTFHFTVTKCDDGAETVMCIVQGEADVEIERAVGKDQSRSLGKIQHNFMNKYNSKRAGYT